MSMEDTMPKRTLPSTAQRLTIYIGESDRWRGKPLYAAILEALKARGIAGTTVTRGVAGFGAHSRIHTAAVLRLSEDLPLRIEVVDDEEHIRRALDAVGPMVREGLITLETVQVVRYTHRYLNPLPADRPVREVMSGEPVTLRPEETVAAAWERMLTHNLKALPVVDADRRVVGILTSEDLIERAGLLTRLSVAQRLTPAEVAESVQALQSSGLSVAEVMTRPVLTARADDPLGGAAERLVAPGLKRLPVVDADGRLVGMLSRVDVLAQVAGAQGATAPPSPRAGTTLSEVMNPDIPRVPQDASLTDMVRALIQSGARRLVVTDKEGRAVGLVSDGDLVARVAPEQRRGVLQALFRRAPAPVGAVTAREVMSSGVLSAPADTPVTTAIALMLQHKRKWLVVTDEGGHPLGLVDRQTLLQAARVS